MKKIILRVFLVLIVLGAAWGGYRWFQQMPQRQQQVATTRVRRGDVIVRAYARGELRAVRSVSLIAPNLFGTVQVTRMAQLGAFAREKDLIVEFDDAEVQSRMEEKQLELDQIDEQIKKSRADLAISASQDEVELLRARYSVRRAELEVKRNDLISPIDAKRNLLTLEETKRRLKQLESDVKSRRERAQAELAVLQERRNKAVLELGRERLRLSQVKLLAPMSGLVAIRQNIGGGFRMMGMQMPDIREGDQVQPGMPVADVLDLSELEISAKVGELDRANLREGQDVVIALDAVAEKRFHGKIKSMSGTATANVFSSDPGKKFDVIFSVDMEELLKGLGAKPEQIRRVLETAEQNRKRPPLPPSMASIMLAGGPPGGGMPVAGGGEGAPAGGMMIRLGGPGGEGGAQASGEGRQRTRGAGGASGAPSSDAERQKMREAVQKALGGRNIQDLSPEEKQKLFEKLRASAPAGASEAGGERKGGGARGERKGGERQGGERREGGPEGSPGNAGLPIFGASSAVRFSEKDLANAKLPPPPEEDEQLDALLRPGLLADVEIIVEKLPNALHLPAQAIFEKDGKPLVYLKKGNRFEEHLVKLARRTESTVVLAEGLQAGEVVALADPNAKPSDKKKKETSSSGGGNPMGGVPASGGESGGGGGRKGGR